MRVCFLSQAYIRRGDDHIGSFVHRLARELQSSGVEVTVVAPHAESLPTSEQMDGVQVVRFRYGPARAERLAYTGQMHKAVRKDLLGALWLVPFLLMFTITAIRTVRRTRSHVIHAHWWFPSGLTGLATSLVTGRPLLVTAHGTDVALLVAHPWARPLAALVLHRAARITAVSPHLQRTLARLFPDLAERISVIPMPIDRIFTRPQPITARRNGGRYVLAVARLARAKGLHDLIAAGRWLLDHGQHVKLIMVGDGDDKEFLEKTAEALTISDRVQFMGVLGPADLRDCYDACDVAVLPSYEEGLGMTLVEAMYCGAPVIGARAGGIPDLITDDETGLLVEPGDVTALAGALQKMLSDHTYARRLAQAGRRSVRQAYDPDALVQRMAAVYAALPGCVQT